MKKSFLIFILIFSFNQISFANNKKMDNDLKNLKLGDYTLVKGNPETCSPGTAKINNGSFFLGANTIFVNINEGKVIDNDIAQAPAKSCHFETTASTKPNNILQTQNYFCDGILIYTSDILLTVSDENIIVKQSDRWQSPEKKLETICEYSLEKVSQLRLVPKASNRVPARVK